MKYNQTGQATIEYILLLFVAVALCTGVLLKFSVGFKNFARSYMGEYVECLLETGELPGLGSTQQSECDYEKLKIEASNDSQGGKGGQTSSGSAGNSSANNFPKSSSGSDGGGGGAAGGSGSGSGGSGLGRGSGKSMGAIVAKTDSDKDKEGEGQGKFRNVSTTEETIRRKSDDGGRSGIGLKGVNEEDKEKVAVSVPVKEGEASKKQKGIPLKNTERKIAEAEESYDFTFGNMIKYMIIFLIVLALIIFFGNQFQQFQKSKES